MNLEAEHLSRTEAGQSPIPQKTEEVVSEHPKPIIHAKKHPRSSRWIILLLAIIIFAVVGWYGIVIAHWSSGPVRFATKIIPFPAVIVNGSFVRYSEVLRKMDIIVWLEDKDSDLIGEDKEELKKDERMQQVIEAAIRQQSIDQLAVLYGIEVTSENIDTAKLEIIGDQTVEEFDEQIRSELNMNPRTFMDDVLRPVIAAQMLEIGILGSEEVQALPREKIQEAKRLLDEGGSFGMVVSEYSDDSSAVRAGDLGYFNQENLPEGWEILLTLPEDSYSDIIETDREFIILRASEIIGVDENAQVRTQAIIVKKRTLEEVIDKYVEQSKIIRVLMFDEEI